MRTNSAVLKSKAGQRRRRSLKTKARVRQQDKLVLTVHRSGQHMYAQVTTPDGAKVLCAASTLMKEIRSKIKNGGNIAAAIEVGKCIGSKCLAQDIKEIVFNRNGFAYHGRVKALAEGARASGLSF